MIERRPHGGHAKPPSERSFARILGDLRGLSAVGHDEALPELLLHFVDDFAPYADTEDVIGNARHEVLFEVRKRRAIMLTDAASEIQIARMDRIEGRSGLRVKREMLDEALGRDGDFRPSLAALV